MELEKKFAYRLPGLCIGLHGDAKWRTIRRAVGADPMLQKCRNGVFLTEFDRSHQRLLQMILCDLTTAFTDVDSKSMNALVCAVDQVSKSDDRVGLFSQHVVDCPTVQRRPTQEILPFDFADRICAMFQEQSHKFWIPDPCRHGNSCVCVPNTLRDVGISTKLK